MVIVPSGAMHEGSDPSARATDW
jgi:4-aminobutyrate aminotransferase-like enzyme